MLDAVLMTAAMHLPAIDMREHTLRQPSRTVSAMRSAATIPPKWRPWAACVLDRESGGTLDRPQSGSGARNPKSSASGRWQFLQSSWGRGLPYMVRDQLVQHGYPKAQAHNVRRWLSTHPISQWPGQFQDMGFIEVVERGGWHHWSLPGSRCQSLVP